MKKSERFELITQYIRDMDIDGFGSVDILCADFVEWYIRETDAKFDVMMFGAHKCKRLSSDLSEMFNDGLLRRTAYGLPGAGMGFPKWVYIYRLPGTAL